MASSNVEFYQRQKELQDSLHEKEQERLHLERQLYSYFKSDQRLSKLRAAKLESYWKKICADEEKSRHRNEQILKDFDRIEGHLSSVTSRTEKLKLLKKQYEEQLKQKYPEWRTLLSPKDTELEKQETESHHQAHQYSQQMTDQSQLLHSDRTNVPHSSYLTDLTDARNSNYTYDQSHDASRFNISNLTSQRSSRESGFEADIGIDSSPHPAAMVKAYRENRKYSHEDISSQIIQEEDEDSRIEEEEDNDSQEDRINLMVYPHPRGTQHILQTHPSRHHEDRRPSMEPVAEEEDEDISDFRDSLNIPDETLPIRPGELLDNMAALPQQMQQDSPSPVSESEIEDVEPFSPMSAVKSEASSVKSNTLSPDLTVGGLVFLLQSLHDDFTVAFSLDGYYRSQHPDLATKKEIVARANDGESLSHIDANVISMLVLEQLTLVVRNFSDGCLLSDNILVKSSTFVNEIHVRTQLPLECQELWDKLFEHFSTLLKHKVMGPQEIAAVFVPGLVADKSEHQDKAFSLLVRLLESSTGEETNDDISSVTFSSPHKIPGVQSPKKMEIAAEVPPLSLGSMIDKQTDEESDFFDQSLPQDPLPLNETAAYKNMLSGTASSKVPAPPQREEDDTDDDVEKQFASVLSPRSPNSRQMGGTSGWSPHLAPLHTATDTGLEELLSDTSTPPMSPAYIPTAVDQSATRSNFGSFSSKNNPALKIGSDLDSDTDMDIPMSGGKSKSKTSLDDDFDFYG